MPGPALLTAFDLSFRISPIFLTGGIAGPVPGSAVPILTYLQPGMFVTLNDTGTGDLTLDQFFAHFGPIPGTTLIENEVAHFPFANQTVAANAIIVQPLHVSFQMICPVNPPNTYLQKLAVMTVLQGVLARHSVLGGMYTVITPTHFYQNCLLTRLVETSRGESQQPQITWQWDFEQPLVALGQAAGAYNNMLGKMAAGLPIGPDASGAIPTSGLAGGIGTDTSGTVPATAVPATAPLGGDVAPTGPPGTNFPSFSDTPSTPPAGASAPSPPLGFSISPSQP